MDDLQIDAVGMLCKVSQEVLLQICKVLFILNETRKGLKPVKL